MGFSGWEFAVFAGQVLLFGLCMFIAYKILKRRTPEDKKVSCFLVGLVGLGLSFGIAVILVMVSILLINITNVYR